MNLPILEVKVVREKVIHSLALNSPARFLYEESSASIEPITTLDFTFIGTFSSSSESQIMIFPSLLNNPPSTTKGSTIMHLNVPASTSIVSLPRKTTSNG